MEIATAVGTSTEQVALLGISDSALAHNLAEQIEHGRRKPFLSLVETIGELRECAGLTRAAVIVVDSGLLAPGPALPQLQPLAAASPLIVLGPGELQPDLLSLVANGQLEFVPRCGNFVPLAASLIERRLRWDGAANLSLALGLEGEDVGELFRHQINNPLTGILGNAEMVLAHRDRLRPADAQRLQTVVDLAVRLRETIRRVSDALDPRSRPQSLDLNC